MKVRWTPDVQSGRRLGRFPNSGKESSYPGVRESPVPGLPWALYSRIEDGQVEILRILHGAQGDATYED